MKKRKIFILTTLLVIFLLGMSACSKSSIDDTNNTKSKPNNTDNETNDSNTDDNSNNNPEEVSITNSGSKKEDNIGTNRNTDNKSSTSSSDVKGSEDTQEKSIPAEMDEKRKEVLDNIQKELNALPTEIEGSRKEFLERLDNIQRELNSLPDKKYSDTGTTNAMKNYYGISYEKYDIALNKIYDLLKKELLPETMKNLKTEQNKWIEQKEAKAEKERKKYAGKTHEWVADFISSYESTKERCYELVNLYITD